MPEMSHVPKGNNSSQSLVNESVNRFEEEHSGINNRIWKWMFDRMKHHDDIEQSFVSFDCLIQRMSIEYHYLTDIYIFPKEFHLEVFLTSIDCTMVPSKNRYICNDLCICCTNEI